MHNEKFEFIPLYTADIHIRSGFLKFFLQMLLTLLSLHTI